MWWSAHYRLEGGGLGKETLDNLVASEQGHPLSSSVISRLRYSSLDSTPWPLSPENQGVNAKVWAAGACSVKFPELTD